MDWKCAGCVTISLLALLDGFGVKAGSATAQPAGNHGRYQIQSFRAPSAEAHGAPLGAAAEESVAQQSRPVPPSCEESV